MVFGKFTEAVSDLTETLRRVFQDPPSHALDPGRLRAPSAGAPMLRAQALLPVFQFAAESTAAPLDLGGSACQESMVFPGRVRAEGGWAQWAAGARVCEMTRFSAGSLRRLEVPSLPRRARCGRMEPEAFRAGSRGYREGLDRPVVRGGSPELASAVARGGLEVALGLPIAIQGQNVQELPKVQWMRYSLQLVKATGENIRNLEVLGLYRIPSKGVASMRHDAKTGRLMVELSREAAGASRLPFLLARRKDDRTLVSCFLEEG